MTALGSPSPLRYHDRLNLDTHSCSRRAKLLSAMAVSRMDAQSQSEAQETGATGLTSGAAPNAAQGPATPPKQGFSTAQILVMAASGCVTALAVLILIVLANDPTLGTVQPPLVATSSLPRITAAFDAPLRAIPPPADPPAPAPPEASPTSPPPAPSPPSLSVVPAPSPSISPLVSTRPPRPTAPPPATAAAPPPTEPPKSNPGPLFQRED